MLKTQYESQHNGEIHLYVYGSNRGGLNKMKEFNTSTLHVAWHAVSTLVKMSLLRISKFKKKLVREKNILKTA